MDTDIQSINIEKIVSNWEKLCRICLTDQAILFPVFSIYDLDEQYNMSFCEMLNTCSTLKVSSNDNFPQLICSLCITHMRHALEFRIKCQSSEMMLTELFHKKNDLKAVIKCEVTDVTEVTAETDIKYHEVDGYEFTALAETGFVTDTEQKETLNTKSSPVLPTKKESTDRKLQFLPVTSCPLCHETYTYRELAVHKRTHPNACWKCNIDFKSVEEHQEHVKEHKEKVCSGCEKVLKNKELCCSQTKIRVRNKLDSVLSKIKKVHTCPICHISCKYKELLAHKKTHPNTCWKCNINFNSVEEHKEHVREHEENVCSECGKVVKNKQLCCSQKKISVTNKLSSTLSRIRKVHLCPICHVSCKYIELGAHKRTHLNTCWKCNICFKSAEEHKEHFKEHEENVCSECGKAFRNKNLCDQHKIVHSKDKCLCTICGKKFSAPGNLTAHLRKKHNREQRYECNYCGKKFIDWGTRSYHIMNHHTFEKPFACDICDKRFSKKNHLVEHLRSHSNEKPFACTMCDAKFKRKPTLNMHLFRHTGEKRVFCKICNKGFVTTNSLKVHMVTHTGEKNFVCSVCNKGFSQAHVLRTHMKTHSDNASTKKTQAEKASRSS